MWVVSPPRLIRLFIVSTIFSENYLSDTLRITAAMIISCKSCFSYIRFRISGTVFKIFWLRLKTRYDVCCSFYFQNKFRITTSHHYLYLTSRLTDFHDVGDNDDYNNNRNYSCCKIY